MRKIALLLAALVLTGCGGVATGADANRETPSALALSGPATARLTDEDVHPVVTDPAPDCR